MHRLKIAYFDYAATTPVDERVVEAMAPYWKLGGIFGNPSSIHHSYGIEASRAVEMARKRVARSIGAQAREIIWTSGATEANNLALRGCFRSGNGSPRRLITAVTEHSSVLDTAMALRSERVDVDVLPVNRNGLVDLEGLERAIDQGGALVSIMWVNNETGVIQPVEEISRLCKKAGAIFHIDAAQAVGKTPVNTRKVLADLISLSAHKAYGPKGIGALFVRKGARINPIMWGGGQEKGLRPGTLPVPMIVGMGMAFDILRQEESMLNRQAAIWHARLTATIGDIGHSQINGGDAEKVPHIISASFGNLEAGLIEYMKKVAVSSGSACATAKTAISHVLRGMGVKRNMALSSLRISIGRHTTDQDIEILERDLVNAVTKLRPN